MDDHLKLRVATEVVRALNDTPFLEDGARGITVRGCVFSALDAIPELDPQPQPQEDFELLKLCDFLFDTNMRYGFHAKGCKALRPGMGHDEKNCDCGWYDKYKLVQDTHSDYLAKYKEECRPPTPQPPTDPGDTLPVVILNNIRGTRVNVYTTHKHADRVSFGFEFDDPNQSSLVSLEHLAKLVLEQPTRTTVSTQTLSHSMTEAIGLIRDLVVALGKYGDHYKSCVAARTLDGKCECGWGQTFNSLTNRSRPWVGSDKDRPRVRQ